MITLTPDDAKKRFGPLFPQKFLVMVDERAGAAEILEQCRVRGTIEWDAMNRRRAGGAVSRCEVEGASMTIHARLGKYPVNFGSAAGDIGGQALEAVEVSGDEVVTTWAGIAGAGVGVAASKLPGIRAQTIHDGYTAHQGVEHDAVNVLCLGARVIGDEVARELVAVFAAARVSDEPRHVRRREKVQELERSGLDADLGDSTAKE